MDNEMDSSRGSVADIQPSTFIDTIQQKKNFVSPRRSCGACGQAGLRQNKEGKWCQQWYINQNVNESLYKRDREFLYSLLNTKNN